MARRGLQVLETERAEVTCRSVIASEEVSPRCGLEGKDKAGMVNPLSWGWRPRLSACAAPQLGADALRGCASGMAFSFLSLQSSDGLKPAA